MSMIGGGDMQIELSELDHAAIPAWCHAKISVFPIEIGAHDLKFTGPASHSTRLFFIWSGKRWDIKGVFHE